ncbi:ABC transporter substrate-binding protein [Gordonia sp. PDNC005]|uniref:siderophore ABC transporter substrate-binding protein n=1 Tax=Gordonia sp. PDNC005 TaxID=2811424 RepID=UPI001963EB8D|nr:ABC transporter substrate-binding protein [Gordonia sp. PDNC005]QRY62651.1 ABC transporter substrate-binding protein [Gordonia sp. PDNC005]
MKFTRMRTAATAAAVVLAGSLALSACSTTADESSSSGETITVSTNKGDVDVPVNPTRVVALDNTSAETLKAFGVTPVAIPKQLYSKQHLSEWIDNSDIKDVGVHSEPKFDVIADVQPDLIIGGYRFSKHDAELKKIADESNGAFIDIAASDDAPNGRVAAMIAQTETLGKIFGKEDQAQQIIADFNTKLDAAKKATNGQTVFLSIVNGGKIDNGAKRMSPLTEPLDVKDVFAGQGGDHHQNSGLTPEAIAQANPQWVIVMDRDAAVEPEDGSKPQPASAVFAAQDAFKNTEFTTKNQIVYLDPGFYLREGIQCYGENYNTIAKTMGGQK